MEETTKPYEISFLLRSENDAAILVKKLSDLGAEISKEGPIERVNLAYPIKKETSAFFGYVNFNAKPEIVKGINDSLGLEPKVMRFLIITPPIEKMIPRRNDFHGQGEQPVDPTVNKPKVEPLSNAELEEKLEEILK
jgi:ribosomal protein S6